VILLAVPMGAMASVLTAIAPTLGPDTIVTDAGSVKGSFVTDAHRILGSLARVVPGHPIAGTERSGVDAAFAELYRGRRVILTPAEETEPEATDTVERLWSLTGANVERLSVEAHDRLLAATSHLPHMLAFGLVDALARGDDPGAVFRYAAGGFRDFTRIASSDPVMWRDICLANRDALLEALEAYRDDLEQLTAEVRDGDGDGLLSRFRRAKTPRDRFCG
jgi:prephenate dehydrogenase